LSQHYNHMGQTWVSQMVDFLCIYSISIVLYSRIRLLSW